MTTLTLDTSNMRATSGSQTLALNEILKSSLAQSVNEVVSRADVKNSLSLIARDSGATLSNITLIIRQDGSIIAKANGKSYGLINTVDKVAQAFEPIKRLVVSRPSYPAAFSPTAPASHSVAPSAPTYTPAPTSYPTAFSASASTYPPTSASYPTAPSSSGPPYGLPTPYTHTPPFSYPTAYPTPAADPIEVAASLKESHFPTSSAGKVRFEGCDDDADTFSGGTPFRRDRTASTEPTGDSVRKIKELERSLYDAETITLHTQNENIDLRLAPLKDELAKINEEIDSYNLNRFDDDLSSEDNLGLGLQAICKNIFYKSHYQELLTRRRSVEEEIKNLETQKEFNTILVQSDQTERKIRLEIKAIEFEDHEALNKVPNPSNTDAFRAFTQERLNRLSKWFKLLKKLIDPSIAEHISMLEIKELYAEDTNRLSALRGNPTTPKTPKPEFLLPVKNLEANLETLTKAYNDRLGDKNPKTLFSVEDDSTYELLLNILNQLYETRGKLNEARTL